jgi:hypothetical protein
MKNKGWTVLRTKGIDSENVSLDFLYGLGDKDKIMLGTIYSDDDIINRRFSNYKACAYHSSDNGNNWSKVILGNGKFTCIASDGNRILAGLGINVYNETATFSDSSKIYYSPDKGVSWKPISAFKDFLIKDIFLSDSTVCILGMKRDDNSWSLKKTKDFGTSWQDVARVSMNHTSSLLAADNNLWSLDEVTNQMIKLSLSSGKVETVSLAENNFKPYLMRQFNNDIFIAGLSGQVATVYKYSNNQLHLVLRLNNLGKDDRYYPIDLFANKNRIVLLLGKRDNIGTAYYLYWNDLTLKEWAMEELPVYHFKPYSFIQGQIWGYNNGFLYYKSVVVQ